MSAPTKVVADTTPEMLACFAKKVVPVTVVIPAKVDTPITFKLLVLTLVVEPPPAAAVIVTIPDDIGERDKLAPKSIVCAVPTSDPLSFTINPEVDFKNWTIKVEIYEDQIDRIKE